MFFSFALGRYDSDEAIDTLPAQLEVLRVFRDLANPDVALIYRLETATEPEHDMAAHFKVLLVGRTADVLSDQEQRSLRDQLAVAFLPAWGVFGSKDKLLPPGRKRLRLEPAEALSHIPLKRDGGPLVDVLRRLDDPIAVDWVCTATDASHQLHSGLPLSGLQEMDAATRFFVAAALQAERSDHALEVRVIVHSTSELDDRVLVQAIGRSTLGVAVKGVPAPRSPVFQQRRGDSRVIAAPEDAIRLFHPPHGRIQGRGLSDSDATRLPARFRVPGGTEAAFGQVTRQGPRFDEQVEVRPSAEDRTKHTYVIGKTGSGKTNLLKHLIAQDIQNGRGVAVIDPHGDLVDHLLSRLGNRIDDAILLDFSESSHLPVFNPLISDVRNPQEAELAIAELLEVIIHRSFNQWTGPVFEDNVRMFLATIMNDSMRSLVDVPSIVAGLTLFLSDKGRRWAPDHLGVESAGLIEEWQAMRRVGGSDLAELTRWVKSKFSDFTLSSVLGLVTSGPSTALSIEDLMRQNGILLVKLPESQMGASAAAFLGSLIFSRLRRAAMSSKRDSDDPFFVHIDEFQKFVSADVEGLVAEARKFGFGLTFAHQNLRQLEAFSRFEGAPSTRIREAIFSNVGTIVCMKISGTDVRTCAEEFAVPESQIRRIGQYQALVRGVVDGVERDPFTLSVPKAEPERPEDAERVRQNMIDRGIWQPRSTLEERLQTELDALRLAWNAHKPNDPLAGPLRTASASNTKSESIPASDIPSGEESFLKAFEANRAARTPSLSKKAPR